MSIKGLGKKSSRPPNRFFALEDIDKFYWLSSTNHKTHRSPEGKPPENRQSGHSQDEIAAHPWQLLQHAEMCDQWFTFMMQALRPKGSQRLNVSIAGSQTHQGLVICLWATFKIIT